MPPRPSSRSTLYGSDVAGRFGIVGGRSPASNAAASAGHRTLERAGGTVVRREQFAYRRQEIVVAATGGREPRGAMLRRLIEGRLEEIFDLAAAGRRS